MLFSLEWGPVKVEARSTESDFPLGIGPTV